MRGLSRANFLRALFLAGAAGSYVTLREPAPALRSTMADPQDGAALERPELPPGDLAGSPAASQAPVPPPPAEPRAGGAILAPSVTLLPLPARLVPTSP